MLPNWLNNYTGIPYVKAGRADRNGLDCWGLVMLIYREQFGIILNEYGEFEYSDDAAVRKRVSEFMVDVSSGWCQVTNKCLGDVVLFNVIGLPVHVGIVLDNQHFIHTYHGSASSVIGRFADVGWKRRIEGFYRHVEFGGCTPSV